MKQPNTQNAYYTQVAELMAAELGWGSRKRRQEAAAAVRALRGQFTPLPAPPPPAAAKEAAAPAKGAAAVAAGSQPAAAA